MVTSLIRNVICVIISQFQLYITLKSGIWKMISEYCLFNTDFVSKLKFSIIDIIIYEYSNMCHYFPHALPIFLPVE